jgi:hypothetical protein
MVFSGIFRAQCFCVNGLLDFFTLYGLDTSIDKSEEKTVQFLLLECEPYVAELKIYEVQVVWTARVCGQLR